MYHPCIHNGSHQPIASILVISYNTKAITVDCLRSVAAETTVPYEVIVFDNASPDSSAAAIAHAFPDIRLIASLENHGFAKGNNLAAREARGKYLLLLNPDTLVLDGAIDRLVAFAERRPEAGIWGGRTLKRDGSVDPHFAFGDQTLWSLFCRTTGLAVIFPKSARLNPEGCGSWQHGSEQAVDAVQGCFLLIRRALWDALGGFDLRFVMYGEDADLCRRARVYGARPRTTGEATIIHFEGASSRCRTDREVLIMKARVTLAQLYLPAWQRPLGVGLLLAWPLSRVLAGRLLAALTRRPSFVAAAEHWRAVWHARPEWRRGFPPSSP